MQWLPRVIWIALKYFNNITLTFFVYLRFRQRLSAPINLVMKTEWKNQLQPELESATEEDEAEYGDDEKDQLDEIGNSRHKYTL